MVGGSPHAQAARERAGEVLGPRARARVDDRRPRSRVGEHGGDPLLAVGVVGRAHDQVGEVRPVKAGRHLHRVAQAEADQHIPGDPRRRRRRAGEQLARAERARGGRQLEVVGAEVVPPLGDAVRLIDDEHADVGPLKRLDEAGAREALRRDVEQAYLAPAHPRERLAVLGLPLLAVDQHRAPSGSALEPGNLVGHQRHQRRDDDRQVIAQQRRQLVAQRLAGTGRHHHQHIAPAKRSLYRLLLPRAEGSEAEVLVESVERREHRSHRR